jgi:hypothetical protein
MAYVSFELARDRQEGSGALRNAEGTPQALLPPLLVR